MEGFYAVKATKERDGINGTFGNPTRSDAERALLLVRTHQSCLWVDHRALPSSSNHLPV